MTDIDSRDRILQRVKAHRANELTPITIYEHTEPGRWRDVPGKLLRALVQVINEWRGQ